MRQHTDNYCKQWQEYDYVAYEAYYDYYEYDYDDGGCYSNIDWFYFLDMYESYCCWCSSQEKELKSLDLYALLCIISSKLFTQISLKIQDLTDARFLGRLSIT